MLDANSDICDADAHDTDLNCHIPVDEASLQRCVAWRVRKKAFSCTSRRLRQNADLRNGRNSPRSRAAQREATVCHVCIDDARGCDLSSIISVSTTSLGRDGAATQWGRAVAPTRADSSSAETASRYTRKTGGDRHGAAPAVDWRGVWWCIYSG